MIKCLTESKPEEQLADVRTQFFTRFFDSSFIAEAKQKMDAYIDMGEDLKIMNDDAIFTIIEELAGVRRKFDIDMKADREKLFDSQEREENNNDNDEDRLIPGVVIDIPWESDISIFQPQERFNYTSAVNEILTSRYSHFGNFKDIECLVQKAVHCYLKSDEISLFKRLIKANKRLKGIILKKIAREDVSAILRMRLERKMIRLIDEEYKQNVKNFELILNDEDFKISINDETILEKEGFKVIKLFFAKELALSSNQLMRILQMFYEIDSNHTWIPGIENITTLKLVAMSKKCFHLKFCLPIIQDRDLLLYMFVNNKLRDARSIQVLFKSYDNELGMERFKLIQRNKEDVVGIDLRLASFEFDVGSEEKIRIKGFIHLNPYLRYLDHNYLTILCRQYIKKFIKSLETTCNLPELEFNEKIIRKRGSWEGQEFYKFYQKELKHYGYSKDSSLHPRNHEKELLN